MKTKKLAKALLRLCNANPSAVIDCDLDLRINIVITAVPTKLTNKQRLALALKDVVKQYGN